MNRVRWLHAQWPTSMRTIGIKMKSMPFTEDRFDGFAIERIRDDFIEGRFIEKYTYQEINSAPFGKDEVLERIGYRSTEFTLYTQFPHIEIRNGQRSIKEFVNLLLEVCNFNLIVSPITVNLLDWISTCQKTVGKKIVIDSIQMSNIEFEEGIVGKILLKGNKDVREAIDDVVNGRRYILEKIQAKVYLSDQKVTIHLTNNGCAKIPNDHQTELLSLLRKAIKVSANYAVN